MIAAVYISFSNSTDSGVFSSDKFNIWYVVDEHTRILLFSIGKILKNSVATFLGLSYMCYMGMLILRNNNPFFFI